MVPPEMEIRVRQCFFSACSNLQPDETRRERRLISKGAAWPRGQQRFAFVVKAMRDPQSCHVSADLSQDCGTFLWWRPVAAK